jgi:ATP-dependent DNA helicase HFM1/MER3
VAIILCETALEAKYKSLISGETILESCLHKNLIEHFTSEICLGTIDDIRTAKTWLRNSFLFQRLQRNPSHYSSLGDKTVEETWQERLDQLVMDSVLTLSQTELISMRDGSRTDDASSFSITDYGEIMSRVGYLCDFPEFSLIYPSRDTVLYPIFDGRRHSSSSSCCS